MSDTMTWHDHYKWDSRFLKLAKEVSTWSKDPSTQVGAIIVEGKNNFISLGYNGFPKNIVDLERELNDRSIKLKKIIHAEINAILSAKRDLTGCTLYTYPFMPCEVCATIVAQAGISTVVSLDSNNPRWAESFERSKELLCDAGVDIHIYDSIEEIESSIQ